MTELNEPLTVIIDPSHERFAQAGQLRLDQGLINHAGDLAITYSDGTEERINNGRTTGLPQYYLIPKNEASEAERLMSVLPDLRERLSAIYDRVVDPANETITLETQMASAAAAYLIAAELHPEFYGRAPVIPSGPKDDKTWPLIENLAKY